MLTTFSPVILLLAAFSAARAQEIPVPVLFDQFGDIVCEDLHARTDSLAVELANNPNATAAIVISPGHSAARANSRHKFINSFLALRKADISRVTFFRGLGDAKLGTAVWIVPAGAEMPADAKEPWPVPSPDLSKPFIFGVGGDLDICPTFVPSMFADLIRGNPGAKAHIVITAAKRSEAKGYGKSLVDLFHRDLGLPRQNMRLFYVIRPKIVGTETEYWFVPARK